MTLTELKFIIQEAVHAKEHSDDQTFAEVLQTQIEVLLSKVEQEMGKAIDDLSSHRRVPKIIEDAAYELHLCHAI